MIFCFLTMLNSYNSAEVFTKREHRLSTHFYPLKETNTVSVMIKKFMFVLEQPLKQVVIDL